MSRNVPLFESLETRRMFASHVVNGTPGNDTIWVYYDRATQQVLLIVNGVESIVPEAQFDDFAVHALGGNDTINVESTPNKPILIDGGEGNDHFATDEWHGDLRGLRGNFTVDGGGGVNDWKLVEDEFGPGRTYTLTADTFGAEEQFTCTYRNLSAMYLQASRYEDAFRIEGTRALTTYTIKCGNGAGLGGIPGDRIYVGVLGGSLADMHGNLTIDGEGWGDVLDIRDTFATGENAYTLTSTRFTHSGGFPAINYAGIESIEIGGSMGNDRLDIESVAANVYVEVYGGLGNDTIRLAPISHNLGNVAGVVTPLGGDGYDRFEIYDDNSTVARDYLLTSEVFAPSDGSTTVLWELEFIALTANNAANDIHVEATAPDWSVEIDPRGGNDSVRVDSTAGLARVRIAGSTDSNSADTVIVGTAAGEQAKVLLGWGSSILRKLEIHTGGSAQVAGAGVDVLKVSDLQMEVGATLNLPNDVLIWDWDAALANPLPRVRALLAAAYAGGTWGGAGITSSNAGVDGRAVGYADARQLFGDAPPPYLGWAIDSTTTLVRATFAGDANLDGAVNLADFNRLAASFGATGGPSWTQGNFNYDGGVNLADFNLLAARFGMELSPARRHGEAGGNDAGELLA